MLSSFEISIGTRFVFGNKSLNKIGEELVDLKVHRVLLHYDGGRFLEDTGLLAHVRSLLSNKGIEIVELGGVCPNPRLSLVYEGIDTCKKRKIEAVVPIGGGSAIDSAKAIALGACYEGDVWDFFLGKSEPVCTLPVISVVTCPAAGSESSQVVVINNEGTHEKLLISHPIIRPTVAIMDPSLTVTLPRRHTACGLVDMYSHICERYFTDDESFGILDRMCEAALRSIVEIAPKLLEHPEDIPLRSEAMWIATIAQNNSLGMGRNQDWATHVLANELSAQYDCVHGETISAIMPSWMKYVYKSNPKRFARYAREVFGLTSENFDLQELALAGIQSTVDFFKELGMPTNSKLLGMDEDGIGPMVGAIDFFGPDHAIGSLQRLGVSDCRSIYEMSLSS